MNSITESVKLRDLLPVIDLKDNEARCPCCGNRLMEELSFRYLDYEYGTATERRELNCCRVCGTAFMIHYSLFMSDGHISRFVYIEDVNDDQDHWIDRLTDEQKTAISEHLMSCQKCRQALDDEILSNAVFAGLIHSRQGSGCGKSI